MIAGRPWARNPPAPVAARQNTAAIATLPST